MAEEPHTYVGKLISNLINLIPIQFEDLKSFWGLEDELNHLRESLAAIAHLVEDAEHKQTVARRWLRDLKQVAYQADDLLSELAYQTTRFKIRNQEVHNFSSISRAINNVEKGNFRRQMVPKLKKLNQSLENIQKRGLSLQLSPIQHNLEDQNRLPTDLTFENSVVGRKADVVKFANLIISSCREQVSVVSIVGLAGVGKTVLAKLVCQKLMTLTRKPFDVEIWVRVSNNFNEHEILGEVLQYLNPCMGLTNEDVILDQLKKELVTKKFLLVLDDVWNYDVRRWYVLKTLLSRICTNNGNAILVTTRSMEVAAMMETSSEHSHQINALSDGECWLILNERAFGNVTTPVLSNLEVIGREIAEKCSGIPLIATFLGGIMGLSRNEETWLKIRHGSVFRGNPVQDNLFMFIQMFYHFPSYLKSCFVFCSNFPKGFLIRKEELIWLWMAEGIVESSDMGNKCFDALLASSLLQEVERDDYDDIIRCKIHDFVHDIALFVSKSGTLVEDHLDKKRYPIYRMVAGDPFVPSYMAKKFRTVIGGTAPIQEIWRMKRLRSLHTNAAGKVSPSSFGKMKHLRYLDVSISKPKHLSDLDTKLYNLQTLNLSNSSIKELPEFITELFNLRTLNLSDSNINNLPESISKLHSLQTLNVSNSNIKDLPESISKLHDLQTLDVSKCNIKALPESIIELWNLETLKFLECKELTKLPRKKINNLISLKHIAFSYEHQMPFGMGKLNGLETLIFFVVGPNRGGSIEELECLNNLRGNLKLTRLEEVGDKKEAERANLQGKANLQGLGFIWSYEENDRSSRNEELLEGLQPHPNIKRIQIKYYMGKKWPPWMLRMKSPGDGDSFTVLNNLVDLRLEWCYNCERLPRLGDLPHLKFLKMDHIGKVKCVDSEFYGSDGKDSSIGCLRLFPALKSLSVSWMENLTEWSSPSNVNKIVVFPCLENLSIQSCPKLTGFPMSDLSELVKLEIRDCEQLRVVFVKQQSYSSLTSLSVVGCSKLTYLQNRLLSNMCLMELSVRRCQWLTFIPENSGKASYLTSLEIYCCKRLRCFSEEILCNLTHLQNLSIGAFSEQLDDFRYLNRIKDLPCLEELEIWGSDFFSREMSSLPNQLQHLNVLRSLKIRGFTTMEVLPEWLTNLQSLQFLSLDYCRHLRCQPTTTILQRFCSLMHLNINCCPILEESESECLQSLDTRIKVEFSHISNARVLL